MNYFSNEVQSMNVLLEKLIPLAEAHQAADEYVAGRYEWNGGACAVGCTIRDAIKLDYLPAATTKPDDHAKIADATGLPEMLWRLADNIFEGLPRDERPAWTPRFLKAAAACQSAESVPARIMARLADRLAGDAMREDVKAAARTVAALWRRRADGDDPAESEWNAAWQQANAAWQQAYAAMLQADAARVQAYAAWQQADAAARQFWTWCANVVIEELSR